MGTQVGTVQNKVREDFSETTKPKKWEIRKQTGGTTVDWASQSSGLRIGTGTAVGEVVLRYLVPFETPVRAVFYALGSVLMSQRIANQEFELRLASDDGTEVLSILLDGTSATTAKQRSSNEGLLATDAAYTIPDTATAGVALELESWIDECYWHARAADNVSARSASVVRNRRIPNPSTQLYLEIVARNTATAASNTFLTLDAITIQDISEMTAEITGGRGGGAASQAVPVSILGSATITTNPNGGMVTPQTVQQALDTVTATALTASQNYTQAAIDLGTTTNSRPTRHRPVVMLNGTNLTPATLVLEESTDGTTFRETWRCPIPIDNQYHTFDVPQHLRYFRWRLINNVATAMTATFLSDELLRSEGPSDIDKNLAIPLTPAAGSAVSAAGVVSGILDLGANHFWEAVRAWLYSDQGTTLYIDESTDGVNWRQFGAGVTIAAGSATRLEAPIICRYQRIRAVNGGTASTVTTLVGALVSL